MLLLDFLVKIYGVDSKGALKYHGRNFASKNGLDINSDMTKDEMTGVALILPSLSKRLIASEIIESIKEKCVEKGMKLADLRDKSYKQIAKVCHPDSATGDTKSFQLLQEIKEFFWNYEGVARDKIQKADWVGEKMRAQGYKYNIYKGTYYK